MKKLVSVVLPVYNGELFLKQAIESIINQTHTMLELIIVNDCSTDKTKEIIEHYVKLDSRIIVINNEVNKKLPASLNIGHNVASGNYITWTSHDNLLKPNFIEVLLKMMEEKGADVVYSNYDVIFDDGSFKRVHIPTPVEYLLYGFQIGASFLYKKDVFTELKGYNEELFLVEDYDFWLRASLNFKFYHLNENLYQYRLHLNSLTSDIQQNKKIRYDYDKCLKLIYSEISNYFKWKEVTLKFLTKNKLDKSISLSDYFKNKKIIKSDILKFNGKHLDKKKIIRGLYIILRGELINNRNNHTFKILMKVLLFERNLLFQSTFSKKKTLKFIFNCLK